MKSSSSESESGRGLIGPAEEEEGGGVDTLGTGFATLQQTFTNLG